MSRSPETTAAAPATSHDQEPDGHRPDKLQLKIGGMSCSFCTGTIAKAVRRLPGVEDVSVSLAHDVKVHGTVSKNGRGMSVGSGVN